MSLVCLTTGGVAAWQNYFTGPILTTGKKEQNGIAAAGEA